MLSGVAAAAAISVSLAMQRPAVPAARNERRVAPDGIMSRFSLPASDPETDYRAAAVRQRVKPLLTPISGRVSIAPAAEPPEGQPDCGCRAGKGPTAVSAPTSAVCTSWARPGIPHPAAVEAQSALQPHGPPVG